MESANKYDVVVVGGGVSGSALVYALATYTDIPKIALVEKYSELATVNSASKNNSQTLHIGDIETNYSFEKASQVRPASLMVARYAEALPGSERSKIIQTVQKMILAVGADEVAELDARFTKFKTIFPTLERLDRSDIERVEPEVARGRAADEPVLALFDPKGYAVNFGALAESFVEKATGQKDKTVDVLMNREVVTVEKDPAGYVLHTKSGDIHATTVIFDTDAYSLGFAKSLGYGMEFSLIPIAGSFYFSKQILRGKVYTMQKPGMPFAAAHGDPDVGVPNATRWGPTARFFPVLESRNMKTIAPYLASSGLQHPKTWLSFAAILLDPTRFVYFLKNLLYELPYVGKWLFVPQVQKIVPTLRARDIHRAKGFGGMRLQRVDTNTRELLLGEGKIVGDHIIFNMTPSPGASVCLFNAMRDAETIVGFLDNRYRFNKEEMVRDLMGEVKPAPRDTSLPDSYAS